MTPTSRAELRWPESVLMLRERVGCEPAFGVPRLRYRPLWAGSAKGWWFRTASEKVACFWENLAKPEPSKGTTA